MSGSKFNVSAYCTLAEVRKYIDVLTDGSERRGLQQGRSVGHCVE